MLRLCESVEEALAHSKRWQIPLLIFVHSSPSGSTAHTDNNNENENAALSGLYTTITHGRKTVNATFIMSGEALARNGAAQRRAFEVVLQESRLSSVAVVHFMDAESPAHQLFVTAVPESSQVVPRLHVFPPPQQNMLRNVLHGATLTPGYISEAIRFVLRMPPLTKVTEVMAELVQHVEEVNAVVRQRRTATADSYGSHIRHHPAPTARAGDVTSSTGVPPLGSVADAALPAVDPKGLHFIALNGLERREVIVTSPGMTLRTVWTKVQQVLVREREAFAAGAEMRPRPSASFVLRVEPPTTAENAKSEAAVVVVVSSIGEASKMDIHSLPHNTVVTVVQNDSTVGNTTPPATTKMTTMPSTHHGDTASGKPSVIVKEEKNPKKSKIATVVECEGGVCKAPSLNSSKTVDSERKVEEQLRGRQKKEYEDEEQEKTVLPPAASTSTMLENGEENTTTATTALSSSVNIRCSLPDGNTHTVSALDPTVATLSTHVRPQVAPLVGNISFVFACAYPPRRFTAEEETETLEKIGLRSSCALRVLLTGGAAPATRHVDAVSFGLMGIVSSLLGRNAAARPTTHAPDENIDVNVTGPSTAPTRSGGRLRTMVELRAEEEEDNRREARNEQQRRKANRYYGGGSTEYTSRHDNDDDDDEYNEDVEGREGEEKRDRKEETRGPKGGDEYAKKNA